ncbi:MAG: DUF2752 domain-containing protein [Bacteroidetes bacterium]|nr:MAG: DUF2752 domain-containing protein [Bacteroidota bacterium]
MLAELSNYLLPCPSMYVLGLPCPGCGMQRAMLLWLQGELWAALCMFPPMIPLILLFGLVLTTRRRSFRGRNALLLIAYFSTLLLMGLNVWLKWPV